MPALLVVVLYLFLHVPKICSHFIMSNLLSAVASSLLFFPPLSIILFLFSGLLWFQMDFYLCSFILPLVISSIKILRKINIFCIIFFAGYEGPEVIYYVVYSIYGISNFLSWINIYIKDKWIHVTNLNIFFMAEVIRTASHAIYREFQFQRL